MKHKLIGCQIFLLLMPFYLYSQENQFEFKRPIAGVSDVWHKIELPDDIFSKIKPDFSDIRIYGFNYSGDTLEVPFFLNQLKSQLALQKVPAKVLNQSYDNRVFSFILEIPSTNEINEILLDFKEKNYDWAVSLEGSQDMLAWNKIIHDYRIVSIKNELTDYTFSTLRFPLSIYKYYRVTVDAGGARPELVAANVQNLQIIPGAYKNYSITSKVQQEDKKRKETTVDFSLQSAVPVSRVEIRIGDTEDYYRPFAIQYLSDSIKSPKGLVPRYLTAYSGVISSFDKRKFDFSEIIASHWRILLVNQDNSPLKIEYVKISGNPYELAARFLEEGNYFLMYGDKKASKPSYDIEKFKSKVPANTSYLQLGAEQINFEKLTVRASPLLQNQLWLWAILGVAILILGAFTIRMLKKA